MALDVTIEHLKIGHDTISWSDKVKYLGMHFKSGRRPTLLVDKETVIRKFYAANAIYSHVKLTSESYGAILNGNVLLTFVKLGPMHPKL